MENLPPGFHNFAASFISERLSVLEQKRNIVDVQNPPSKSYVKEIRCLMHIFGDCRKPLTESVLYMEKILRQQINLLLIKVAEITTFRGGDEILPQDLLFLLRKNKVKLKRLLKYLDLKDTKEALSKTNTNTLEIVEKKGKRVRKCLEFLSEIDNVFMYTDIMETNIPDPDYERRMERKWKMVQEMSDEEYIEFSKIAETTFLPKNQTQKFRAWLMEDNLTHLVPTNFALEIVNYFARETIAEIIDRAILVKEKNKPQQKPEKVKQEKDGNCSQDYVISFDTNFEDFENLTKNQISADENPLNAITVAEIKEALQPFIETENRLSNEFSKICLDGLLLCLICR